MRTRVAKNTDYYIGKLSSVRSNAVDSVKSKAKEVAKKAYKAMKGAGTDEAALQEALLGLTPEEAQAVEAEFTKTYGKSITAWIKSDTSGDLEDSLLAVFEQNLKSDSYFDANATAEQIHKAVDRWGTDEDSLKRAVEGLTKEQADEVKAVYKKKYGKSVVDAIKADTSGKLEKYLLNCLKGKSANTKDKDGFDAAAIARKCYNALEGWGTDEAALQEALTGLTPEQANQVKDKFKDLCGKDLIKWIKSDTSGDLEDQLIEVFD